MSSTASSVFLKAEVERAALLPKAAALKQKQDLERQEAELKAKKEELELETAIAASDAKLKVLDNFETGCMSPVNPTHERDVEIRSLASGERHERRSHMEADPFQLPQPQTSNANCIVLY